MRAKTRTIHPAAGLAVLALLAAAVVVLGVQDATGAQPPAFVQQVSKRASATSVALQPTASITAGNRIVVEAAVWSSAGATASAVTDSAGNSYTELTHFAASEKTELSVWSAPITAGGGTRPTVTVKASGSADIGATVLEYSGLSSAGGISAVDQSAHATATTGASASGVSSGPTAPTSAAGELAVGFYADSGFNSTLAGDAAYTVRANVSPTQDIQMLVQDQVLAGAGATPNPMTLAGPKTPWLAATIVFKSAAPSGPATAPATPGAPTATAGDGQASVSWTAPDDGGSAITSYTVTPYDGSTALPPTVVSGTPAPTSATVKGLKNGTGYTFTVKATNSVATSGESAASSPVTPGAQSAAPVAFVQEFDKHAVASSLALTPGADVANGDRIVVEAGVFSNGGATAASVTDSAGNTYTELTKFKAPDNTEMSVWTAPVTAGGVSRPTITVKATGSADMAAAALEYSGLSTAAGASVVDQMSVTAGKTGAATTVSSGATAPTSASGELALGLYADSGFSNTLGGDPAYAVRANVSPTGDMELLAQDRVLTTAGATPNPGTKTGANTPWAAATVVLRAAAQGPATAPGAPLNVTAAPGDARATVNWTAPADGGSPITSYTVTPYVGSTAQTPTLVSGNPPNTTADITGLTNGTSYTFTITATNALGSGPASAASNAVTPSTSPGGQWSALMNWPLVAVHSVVLNNGNLLLWDGWQQPQPTTVWNPTAQTFPTTLNAPGSIFCAGNAHLPDGRILVAGGDGTFTTGQLGLADTAIFDPKTSTWSRVADMHMPRWYPSLTELADGRYVAISGNSKDDQTWADTPEVYDPATNTWTLLSGVSTPQVHEEEYPYSYLLPSGKIFTIGPKEDNSFLLDVAARTWTPVGGPSGVVNGASVMYRPGKILYAGGAPLIDSGSPAKANAAVIDLTSANPAWRSVAPMNHARDYQTLTNLPDGTVLAVGGENSSDQSIVTTGVLPAEIWDPSTEKWTEVAPMAAARNYHGTAVLMPDGRVLVAGGGHFGDGVGPGQYSAQFYSPPYLFKGARPTITNAPSSATYGSDMTVATPDAASIKSVSLVNLGADTHQSDMDQHFVPLNFTASPGSLTVQAPGSAALAPPGDYMLFIVNDKGVPSVASIVHMAGTLSAPAVPAAPTAAAGDGQATVSWTAPEDGGSPIASYKVTPYIGSAAQAPTTVSGTSATIKGLANGTTYTFTVAATNAIGTSAESPASNAVTPAAGSVGPVSFVQGANKRATATSVGLALPGNVTAGDRLVVEAGIWSGAGATASAVTDSAGNTYTELTHFKASDKTELSVWTAPVTAGGGTKPTVSVKATGSADIGATVLEYSGLSTAAGTGVLDAVKTATGTTGSSATGVSSGATTASTAAGDLALGVYTDSGFSNSLTGDPTYRVRTNVSPTGDIELLAQDKLLAGAGTTANAVTNTGPRTPWLAATLLLKAGAPAGGAMMSALRVSGGDPAPTAAARRIYAFPVPRLTRPVTSGILLLCPLAKWAQRLAPQPFTLHPLRPHPRTSKRHRRRGAARSASSSGAAKRPGHRARGGARVR